MANNMMKKARLILLLTALAVTFFSACSSKTTDKTAGDAADTYAGYMETGKVFAAQIGDVYGSIAKDIFKAKQVQEFTFVPDMLETLRLGKVDAAILDSAFAKQIQDSGQYPDLDYLPVPKEVFIDMAANVFHKPELRDKFNEWFETILKDGTFDEIYNRWIGVSLPDEKDIPRFDLTGENGTLRVCNTGNFPPFSYMDSNNHPVGFDEEIVSRFAEYLGMNIEHSAMSYDGIIPYVLSGKADMSSSAFTVTDDRSNNVIYGTAYAKATAVLVIKKSGSTAAVRDYTAFSGKDIAVITGNLTINSTDKIGGNPVMYNDSASAAEDVKRGRVAGFMHTLTAVQVMATHMESFEVFPVPKEIFSGQIGAISYDKDMIDRFDTFLSTVKSDGTLKEMQDRWFSNEIDLDAPIPQIENSGANGVLEVAMCSDSVPYAYVGADGQYTGFSVELAMRFGAYEGMSVKFIDMEFGGMIPYIVSKKADISISNLAITDERKKSVLFSEPFFDEQHGILALKLDTAADTKEQAGGFIPWLKTGIERNLMTDNRWKMVLDGLGVTMTIAVLAQIFGTAFGCFICWLLMRRNRFIRWIGNLYCGLIYGTPIVVLLMITYYIIFGNTSISNVLVAVAAFTMITSAGVAQTLKGAIETVDLVEIEAARSIGFTAFKAFKTITLPQAVKRALPGYSKGFVELVKATAIVGYIAIQDLTRAGDIIRSRTYDAYFPLLLVAIIYLVVTTICVQLFKFIVKKVNKRGGSQ